MNSIDKNWVDNHIDSNGEVVIPEGVEKIEPQAFAQNKNVRKVIMPNSVSEIGDKSFALCPNLEEIQWSNGLRTIDSNAFYGCTSLTNIELPQSLENLGSGAFRKCSQLKFVRLGNGIKTIEGLAFDGCGLEQVDLPDSIEKIDVRAFSNCPQLTSISGADSITQIESGAFQGTSITSYEVPRNVSAIYSSTFSQNPKLRNITLNENIQYLSERAFSESSNIEQIVINGTQRIKYGAFMQMPNVKKVTIDGQEFAISDNEQLFSLQKAGEKVVIVTKDEQGKFQSRGINLEKGTTKVLPQNLYLGDDGKLCYAIHSLADFSPQQLEILKKSGMTQLYIYGGNNEIMPSEQQQGLNFNLYSIDDLIAVKTKIEELKRQIKLPPQTDKHRDKKIYAQIVRCLGETIEYDHWGAGDSRDKYERMTRKKLRGLLKRK